MDPSDQYLSKKELRYHINPKETEVDRKEEKEVPKAVQEIHRSETNADQWKDEDYFRLRSETIRKWKEDNENPYPHKFNVNLSLTEFTEKFGDLKPGTILDGQTVSFAGRLLSKKKQCQELTSYILQGDGTTIQIMADASYYASKEAYTVTNDRLRCGDIVGITGTPGKTKSALLIIVASKIVLIAPCLHLLPQCINKDTTYRQRYLDLIINETSRQKFITRTKLVAYVRKFLDDMNFLEVETPLINLIPGGSTANSLIVHHMDLEMDLHMRVAPELHLKMLVVGGLDRVYELGRQFRNDSIDSTHNPEFTSCEFYMAYADYEDLMKVTETLISGMVKYLTGRYEMKYHPEGPEGPELQIDYTPPFRRISVITELERKLFVKFPSATDLTASGTRKFLDDLCVKHNLSCTAPRTVSRLLQKLIREYIEKECIHPTFIIDFPEVMSPYAKGHRSLPGLTERFELFVCKTEICNAYTELNDPVVQRERLAQQTNDRAVGDVEAAVTDENFCTSLEYGLPPTAGCGIGIDRLCMFFTDSCNIKEVLLFPTMKPGKDQTKVKTSNDDRSLVS